MALPGFPDQPRYNPEQLHTRLIERLHGAIGRPDIDAARKSEYGGMLAKLLGGQAKAVAGTGAVQQGRMGTAQDTSNPTGLPEGVMIQPTTTWAGNPLPGVLPAQPDVPAVPQVNPQVATLLGLLRGGGQFAGGANPILSALGPRLGGFPGQRSALYEMLRGR